MAGYLTKVMILIKTEEWLGRLVTALETKKAALLRERRCFSDTEESLLTLARRARSYLRADASLTPAQQSALIPARIENHVGEGISKYAYVGAIGPDFPGDAYVFTLRHRWVAETMHRGSPRRAWVQAGTTEFVLKLLDNVRERNYFSEDQRRAMMSYAIGHLSSVASDVIINPFIYAFVESTTNQDAGSRNKVNRREFEVEMDAQVARGFFQRPDMKTGQDWEDYFLEKGDNEREIEWLTDVYLEAFRRTYRGEDPQEPLCHGPASDCPVPRLSRDFLIDGYRNTTAWALDVGYDQTPWIRAILFFLWLGGGMAVVWQFWSATQFFDTMGNSLFDWNKAEVEAVRASNLAGWNSGGFFANERAWFDALDVSYTWSGFMVLPFSMLLGGTLGMSGLFGQGTTGLFSRPGGVIAFKLIKYAYTFGAKQLLNLFATSFWHHPVTRWIRFVIDQVIDAVQQFVINKPSLGSGGGPALHEAGPLRATTFHSAESGREGYKLDYYLWFVQMGLFGAYFFSAMFTFGLKSARTASGGGREIGYSGLDFIFGALVPFAYLGVFLGAGGAEKIVVKGTTGSDWPSERTNEIDPYLPVATSGDRHSFSPDRAEARPVRLMRDDAIVTLPDSGKKHYPEDSRTGPGDARDAADERLRREGSDPTTTTFNLARLFDKAAQFSGLLAMAAVNYDTASPAMKDRVKAIFKDWNLDYLAVSQWGELMSDDTNNTGLLGAVGTWFDDLTNNRLNTDEAVIDRIGREIPFASLSGTIHADFDHDAATSVDAPVGRCRRFQRPGAILLPNLDVDTPPPDPLPATLPSRADMLDATGDLSINAGNDADEFATFEVRKPATPAPNHELSLRVHLRDAERIHVFMETTGPSGATWSLANFVQFGPSASEFALPSGAPDRTRFRVEAVTLAGDVLLAGPTGATPTTPAPVSQSVAVGSPAAAERLPSDVWVEVIHKESGAEVQGVRDVALFTIAPFMLISPQQPTERVYVAYYPGSFGNHPTVADLVEALTAAMGPTRAAVRTTTVTGGGTSFVPHRPVAETHADAAKGIYIVDGNLYRRPAATPSGVREIDQWLQDEFELGYCMAPQAWMHMALHCPRRVDDDGLGAFLTREIPAANVALYNTLTEASDDSINYGGNIEVSPPVAQATAALPPPQPPAGSPPQPASSPAATLTTDSAGFPVPAHDPAPFGKIIIGEGGFHLYDMGSTFMAALNAGGAAPAALVAEINTQERTHVAITTTVAGVEITVRLRDHAWLLSLDVGGGNQHQRLVVKAGTTFKVYRARLLEPDYWRVLNAQRVQPLVSVDTSWLFVGHVDEIFTIVRANRDRNFKLVMASTQLAANILDRAIAVSRTPGRPLTELFRGKRWSSALSLPEIADVGLPATAPNRYFARISAANMLSRGRASNAAIQAQKLTPIEHRLRHVLGLPLADTPGQPPEASDVIYLPVFYDRVPTATVANGASTSAFTPNLVNLLEVDGHVMLPRPFGARMRPADALDVLTHSSVGLTGIDLGRDIRPLLGHWHWARRPTTAATIGTIFGVSASSITSDAKNAGKFNSSGQVRDEWGRIWVPEDNVDLFEAYTSFVLKRIGLTVHFIDDWDYYHVADGEVHCATNVKRTPPERVTPTYAGPYWWDTYR